MEYPEVTHLYKYCSYTQHCLSILIKKKIWLAKPESFNDPFDCNIRFKPKTNSEALKKYIDITGRSTGNPDKDLEIYLEGLKQFQNKDMKNFGVFAMSQINDNILMWSHYADKHKGFCIEFERLPNNLLGDYEITQPIDYCCDYPDVDPLDSTGNIDRFLFRKMLFSKAKDWAYEKEWRLAYDEGDKEEAMPANISSIIFGLKMLEQQKNDIREILKGQPEIRYQQAIEIQYQFRLKIIDL
jgi:hypothetical protein